MPPDVFLVLASSGITLVASLMFFVSDEAPPREPEQPEVSFCAPPPRRPVGAPPPLPQAKECSVDVSTPGARCQLTLRPRGDEWEITLEATPMTDAPARRVDGQGELRGPVGDLRWHGQAGVPRSTRRSWKQKPGRA